MLSKSKNRRKKRETAMSKLYFEEFRRRVTDDAPYAVFHRENVHYVAHIHEEIEAAYVAQGSVRVLGERCEQTLNAGDIYLFMPDEIHALESVSENRMYILRILPKQIDRVDFSVFRLKKNVIRPNDPGYAPLRTAVLQMVEEDTARRAGWELAMRKCRYEIFLTILRCLEYEEIQPEEKQRLASHTALLRNVNDFIVAHYQDPISLESAAAACGYSKYYFAHCIKQITGGTFVEFLILYRLNIARARIRDTEDTVTEIALDSGFGNLRSFNRMFRKYYGTTPTEYRKQTGAKKM